MNELIFFVYGLAFFSLGLASLLEMRESSKLALGRQLPWLAAFGVLHSVVAWCDMFLLNPPGGELETVLSGARTLLLPISVVLLIRFGIGLITEVGPMPDWVTFARAVLFVPAMLLVAFALVVTTSDAHLQRDADTWSRYLLFLPGSLMTAIGFVRHWRQVPHAQLNNSYRWLAAAALASLVFAITGGLIVSKGPYGLAPWLNTQAVEDLTGVPMPWWRAGSAVALTITVIRALGVFSADRKHQLEHLQRERERSQQAALAAQRDARQVAEKWIETLVQISRQIATLEPLDQILANIVGRARLLMPANGAALALWDEDFVELIVKALASGDGTTTPETRISKGPLLDAAISQKPILLPENGGWHCSMLDLDVRAAVIAPLTFEGETLGVLWAVSTKADAFSPADLDHVEQLSDQAVIAIQHALMAARLQSLAVVEERARIAREMHDGLAQLLGYMSLEVQTLDALVRQNNQEATLAELKQARERITGAQGDVRENILSLRTTLAGEAGLVQALEEYIAEFGVQTGIVTRFANELIEPPRLSPLAETQLVCIVQEALANVRKHSQAQQVQIRMLARNGCVHVTITDDGVGFMPRTTRSHFGLQTMLERSQSVGGGLTVTSVPDDGTQVALWLPRMQQ